MDKTKLPYGRLTFDGNFCDIAKCREERWGKYCPDGACSQRKVWERLKESEDTTMSPTDVQEYKKFEDELIASGMTFNERSILTAPPAASLSAWRCSWGMKRLCIARTADLETRTCLSRAANKKSFATITIILSPQTDFARKGR